MLIPFDCGAEGRGFLLVEGQAAGLLVRGCDPMGLKDLGNLGGGEPLQIVNGSRSVFDPIGGRVWARFFCENEVELLREGKSREMGSIAVQAGENRGFREGFAMRVESMGGRDGNALRSVGGFEGIFELELNFLRKSDERYLGGLDVGRTHVLWKDVSEGKGSNKGRVFQGE